MSSNKLDGYETLYTIGTGSYGTCKKVRRKSDGKVLVWKELEYGSMSEAEKQLLVSEVNLLRELRHKNIVRYYDRVVDKRNTTIYIIMEYCEGGDLGTLISKCRRERKYLEEEFVWKLFRQITLALQECHRRGQGRSILHRDLKPANVFLDKHHNVKLGDFGLARVLKHDTSFAKTFVGTPYYMSPEQMSRSAYNDKSDIWSLGCLIYEVCALNPPFTASNQSALAIKIREGSFKRIPSQYSDELQTTIASMLRVSSILRPSIDDLLKLSKLAPKPDKSEPVSSTTTTTAEPPSSTTSKETDCALKAREESLNKKEELLDLRDRATDLSERRIASREKRLEERERFLDAREKAIAEKERLAEDKVARAETLMEQYISMKTKGRVMELKTEKVFTEAIHPEHLHSNLHKKRVHFAAAGKENQLASDDTTAIKAEPSRTSELKERLYQAKLRGVALKQVETTSKYKSKKLLSMR